jgi:hypothetical protein
VLQVLRAQAPPPSGRAAALQLRASGQSLSPLQAMDPQCPSAWQDSSTEHGLLEGLQGAWQRRLWLQSQGLGSTSQIWETL